MVAILSLTLPILVRHITGTMLVDGRDNMLEELIYMGVIMFCIVIAQTIFSIFRSYKGHDMGAKMERDMRKELFSQYQKLPFSFYDERKVGELMSRISNDLYDLSEMFHHTPENILMHGIQFIGSLVILFIINWQLSLIISILLLAMILYSYPFYHKMKKVSSKNHSIIANVNSVVQENLMGIRLVKSFTAEDCEIEKFAKENEKHYEGKKEISKYEAWNFETIQSFFRPLITIAIVIVGGIWIYLDRLNAPDLLIFILYAGYLTAPIPALAFMVEQVQNGLIGYSRFIDIMEIQPEVQDDSSSITIDNVYGEICFHDVSFAYKKGQNVLRNINLRASSGETVAIVGRSGIGKTTLCSLIPRFYDVSEGAITLDGVDINTISYSSLRQNIGVVRQETFLFAGTIMENILYGDFDATEQQVIDAAKKANAHEFIVNLPDGYYTDIGQRGVRLSGGQQQRLSIARVFLKNPPILIFDEATSALDYESEQLVMNSLKELAIGRTTFIIAHRLSTIQSADRILVMSDGRISEEGTHEELWTKNGYYKKLYKA